MDELQGQQRLWLMYLIFLTWKRISYCWRGWVGTGVTWEVQTVGAQSLRLKFFFFFFFKTKALNTLPIDSLGWQNPSRAKSCRGPELWAWSSATARAALLPQAWQCGFRRRKPLLELWDQSDGYRFRELWSATAESCWITVAASCDLGNFWHYFILFYPNNLDITEFYYKQSNQVKMSK